MLPAPKGQSQGVQKVSLHRQWQSARSQRIGIFILWLAAIFTDSEDTLHPWQAGEAMLVLPLAGSKEQLDINIS